jgi:pimeloyl-ACP methyl ester carboxylesterase
MTTTNAPRHLVRPGNRRVAYYDLAPDAPADAPVVLFCHAAPGSGAFDPDPAVTAAHGVRLISLDRPGYGGSDPVGDDEFATIDAAADDAAALLDETLAPGGRAGAVGWSAGGRVALALAARRPELVDRVAVLASPAPDEQVPWIPDEFRPGLDALRGVPAAAAYAALTPAFAPTLDLPEQARFGLAGVAEPDAAVLAGPGVADRLRVMLDRGFAQGVTGMVADIVGYSLRPWGFDPADVAQPVLLGYGADDALVGAVHGEWYRKVLPSARLELVPGVGHLVVVPFWAAALRHLTASNLPDQTSH